MKVKMLCFLGALVLIQTQAQAKSAKKEKSNRSPANVVCEEKAKAIARSVHQLEWPEMPIQSVSAQVTTPHENASIITYSIGLDVGGKFDAQMNLEMSPSGPQACYLISLRIPAR